MKLNSKMINYSALSSVVLVCPYNKMAALSVKGVILQRIHVLFISLFSLL